MIIRNNIYTGRLIGFDKLGSFNTRFRSSYNVFYTANHIRSNQEMLELEYVVKHIKR